MGTVTQNRDDEAAKAAEKLASVVAAMPDSELIRLVREYPDFMNALVVLMRAHDQTPPAEWTGPRSGNVW